MQNGQQPTFPPIAAWRVNIIRLVFLLMAGFMGSFVWYRLIFESADIPVQQGLGKKASPSNLLNY